MKPEFKKGDYVYYYQRVDDTYNTVPAKVLKVNSKTLKIDGNFIEGDRVVNVKKSNCELQKEYSNGR